MPFKVVSAEPNDEVIEVLRELSHEAYAGRVQVLVAFYLDDSGDVQHTGAGSLEIGKLILAADEWVLRLKMEKLYPNLVDEE